MTFFDDVARPGAHADLVLSIEIDGIPYTFAERTVVDIGRTLLRRVLVAVREGATSIDPASCIEQAPTLDIEMLDDDDGTLAALFAVLSPPVAYIDADLTAAGTSITFSDTGSLSSGQTVYVDGETILLGGTPATPWTGCTRAQHGSKAEAHYASSTHADGAPVYAVPPSWVGRRLQLYGHIVTSNGFVDDDRGLLGVFVIDGTPRHMGDNRWSMRCAGIMSSVYQRSIGVGLGVSRPTGSTFPSTTTRAFIVDDASPFETGTSVDTYAMVTSDNGNASIHKVTSVNVGGSTVTIDQASLFDSANEGRRQGSVVDIRPVQVIGGSTGTPMLWVLVSDTGQGVTTHDRLPGRAPSALDDPGWRFGAAIETGDIDLDAFTDLRGLQETSIVIDEEAPLVDVLREWCQINDLWIVTDTDGKISIVRKTERATATTIGPDDLIPDVIRIDVDENTVNPLGTVSCDYSPQDQDYGATLNLIDVASARKYPRNKNRLSLELRSIGTDDGRERRLRFNGPDSRRWAHPSSKSAGEIMSMVADIMRQRADGPSCTVAVTTSLKFLSLRIGALVQLSGLLAAYSDAPDMRGGTLDGVRARVVSRRPDYESGTMQLALELADDLMHVAPAAVIASAAGSVITLATSGDEVSGATPQDDFYVGCSVFCVDRSTLSGGAPVVDMHTVTVIQSAPPRLTLSPALSFVPDGATDYVMLYPSVSGTTVSGYVNDEIATMNSTNDPRNGLNGTERFG